MRCGFTKVEMLIVVTIMGCVSLVSYFNFASSQVKARDKQRKTDVKQIADGLDRYFLDYGQYPPSEDGKIIGCGSPKFNSKCEWGLGDFKDTDGTVYVPRISSDPIPARSEYVYVTDKNLTKYQIFAALEDRRDVEWMPGIMVNCASKQSAFLSCNFGVTSPKTTTIEQLN